MGLLDKTFYHAGKASAQRPCTSILIGVLITAIGAIGFVNYRSTVSALLFHPFLTWDAVAGVWPNVIYLRWSSHKAAPN